MKFVADQKDIGIADQVIRYSELNGQFIDAWIEAQPGAIRVTQFGLFSVRVTDQGVWGKADIPIEDFSPLKLREKTTAGYLDMFDYLDSHRELKLARMWNFVPQINRSTPETRPYNDMYQNFNRGRHEAFAMRFGSDPGTWRLPAASGVGTKSKILTIEFFAIAGQPVFLENKLQIPAKDYSRRYGPRPPLFARGVFYKNAGQQFLLSSGTAAIKGEDSLHYRDIVSQFRESVDNLRILAGDFNLRQHQVDGGFALEHLQLLRIYCRFGADFRAIENAINDGVAPNRGVTLIETDICRPELLVEIEGIFLR